MTTIYGKFDTMNAAISHIKNFPGTTGWVLIVDYRINEQFTTLPFKDYAAIRSYMKSSAISTRSGDKYAILRNGTVLVQTRQPSQTHDTTRLSGASIMNEFAEFDQAQDKDAQIAALQKRIEELEAVMQPFCAMGEAFAKQQTDPEFAWWSDMSGRGKRITVADLYAVVAALLNK